METVATQPSPKTVSLVSLIEREKRRRQRRLAVWVGLAGATALVGVGVYFAARPRPAPMPERFRSVAVAHGDVVREVRATGRVDAVSSVSVGAEISGRIATVEVDFNDHVTAGQVMARFDRSALEAQRAQSEALLASAKAQLAQAKSDLVQAHRNKQRADELFANGAMALQEHETVVTAAALSEARLGAAAATVAAQAAMATVSKTNLEHTIIRAPIDGMVITRNIDPGQTVASMLQAPVLFMVAADLRKMQVAAAIDEADIGEVENGQSASFTVNAWPDRVFKGAVIEVRNSPQLVQDIVTYDAVISVDNLDLALKPGMTASVRIRTATTRDTASVPNAALHFTPPGEARAPASAEVWVLEANQLTAVPVHAGLTDGEVTAIAKGALPEGTRVLVDLTPEGKKAYGLVPKKQ